VCDRRSCRVIDEAYRPKLESKWEAPIKTLISECWHPSPQRRPTMPELVAQLKGIASKNKREHVRTKRSQKHSESAVRQSEGVSSPRDNDNDADEPAPASQDAPAKNNAGGGQSQSSHREASSSAVREHSSSRREHRSKREESKSVPDEAGEGREKKSSGRRHHKRDSK
jgi:hypothetical protein